MFMLEQIESITRLAGEILRIGVNGAPVRLPQPEHRHSFWSW